jgi:hypothetical protein
MKYAIIEVVNGNFFIRAEGITSIAAAKNQYHGRCQTLWNATDVLNAYVMIADEQLDCVEGYKEFVHHDPQPEPTPEPEEA